MNSILRFEGVSFSYKNRMILNDASFSIQEREFVLLTGKSGSGKSTLLKLTYGAELPENGTLEAANITIPPKSKSDLIRLRRKIGIVFQEFRLLSDRTVAENLSFVLHAAGNAGSNANKKVNEALSEVGLIDKAKAMPDQLSGGETQRVAIARAIINDPVLLLADEPTGNLDPETTTEIFDLLKKINIKGTAVLIATHNYDFITKSKSKILFLENAKLTEMKR